MDCNSRAFVLKLEVIFFTSLEENVFEWLVFGPKNQTVQFPGINSLKNYEKILKFISIRSFALSIPSSHPGTHTSFIPFHLKRMQHFYAPNPAAGCWRQLSSCSHPPEMACSASPWSTRYHYIGSHTVRFIFITI